MPHPPRCQVFFAQGAALRPFGLPADLSGFLHYPSRAGADFGIAARLCAETTFGVVGYLLRGFGGPVTCRAFCERNKKVAIIPDCDFAFCVP